MKSIDRIRDAVAGWNGTFTADDDAVLYLRDDCKAGTCDCNTGECGYTIASELDDHVAESLAVLLNAGRALMPVVEAALAWHSTECVDACDPSAGYHACDEMAAQARLFRAVSALKGGAG